MTGILKSVRKLRGRYNRLLTAVGLATVAVLLVRRYASSLQRVSSAAGAASDEVDKVDLASQESFPASDSPAY